MSKLVLAYAFVMLFQPINAEEFSRVIPELTTNYQPDTSGTEGGLWLIMKDAEDALKNSPSRINDPELDTYLYDLVCKLIPEYCLDIRIYVIRRPYFNATMAPNGMMQIWTGLLLRAKNEAQLSSVLGHEIGHYLRRHSVKRFDDAKFKTSLFSFLTVGIVGAVATGNMNANAGRSVLDISQFSIYASIFAYGRAHESEADKYGIQLLADAGMKTAEAAKLWESLTAEFDAANYKKPKPSLFFSTHPAPKDRIRKLNAYSRTLSSRLDKEETLGLKTYQERISIHMKTMLSDELNLRQFGQTQYLFQSLLADGISPGLVNYYLGELHRIRKEEGDFVLAKQYYEEAKKYEDHDPALYRSLGIVYLKEKNYTLAHSQFSEYLARLPEATDREMIEYYMKMGR
jgi:predicted Zn-dependent protease